MTAEPPPAAPSGRRARGARLAAVAAAVLLLVALGAGVAANDPDAAIRRHREAIAAAGLLCGAAAVALAAPATRRRAAAAAISVTLALAAGEALLRATVGAELAGIYRLHDTWLFEHVPGATKVNVIPTPYGERRVAFDVDSDGFRGPELRPPGAAKRVVVYGDSFIAARATPLEETYVARLGDELRAALSVDVETVNAGVIGYGPDQVLLRMEAELPRLRPDLVVVSVLAENDYGDLVRNRLFELGPGNELVRRHPALSDAMRDAYASAQSGFVLPKVAARFEGRLRAALHGSGMPATGDAGVDVDGCTLELLMCRDEHQAAVVERCEVAMCDRPDHPDADVRLEPSSGSARHKVELMAAVLAAIRDVTKRNGVALLLLVVPSASDVCKDYDMDAVPPGRYPEYRPENLTTPIERIADAYGIPNVALCAPFRATDANALYFHGGDTHWNSAGQALAAKLTARRVAERGLLR